MDLRGRLSELLRGRATRAVVVAACLLPLGLLVAGALSGTLGANPIDDITDGTGTWTLRFLLITLTITPIRVITGLGGLIRYRRLLGLAAFFYGSLHLLTYLWLDQFFAFEEIVRDIARRPFIAVGFTSFVLMIPLALTSADRVARWMGGRRWKLLHRMVYAAAAGGVLHYLWLVKADTRGPLLSGLILVVLFAFRIVEALRRGRWRRSPARIL